MIGATKSGATSYFSTGKSQQQWSMAQKNAFSTLPTKNAVTAANANPVAKAIPGFDKSKIKLH